jgi:D-tyrosyl-tRNA(Tyr) deacylase
VGDEIVRAVVQRVSQASVTVGDQVVGHIGRGLLVLLGIKTNDTEAEAKWMAQKIAGLRIFADDEGKFNLSLRDVEGVSQFTLYGDARKGRRPSFTDAAPPDLAELLVNRFVELLRAEELPVETGVFGALMQVEIHNDGPVTLILEK